MIVSEQSTAAAGPWRLTRRGVLRGAALAALAVGAAEGLTSPARAGTPGDCDAADLGGALVRPDDPRYQYLVNRGYNARLVGSPDEVRVVRSTGQVVRAVQAAVDTGRQLAVRSGGHDFEGFPDDPAVRLLVDLSDMDAVSYDAGRRAFVVEAGARLGEVYEKLCLGWGVTVPGGWCPAVGAGGHIMGGGYGPLSRLHGLSSDHLYAVEVVVVDAAGQARAVVATREQADPNRDLWWAHTGGGGGNFGVVTRYFLRAPGATGTDPASLLPAPPGSVLSFSATWPWDGMDQANFARLAKNFATWCERNNDPARPGARIYSELYFYRKPSGMILLEGQIAGADRATQLLDEHLAALSDGVTVPYNRTAQLMPWLNFALVGPNGGAAPHLRIKVKAAYLRASFTDGQLATAYRHLTRTDYANPIGAVSLDAYGGMINRVPAAATAAAHRDSIIKLSYLVGWSDPAEDQQHIQWIREFYRDMYADTGGVPVSGPVNDGAYINYPDADLADPQWNTSGVPWSTLYYKDNYRRLQRAKATWDPRDVFHHRAISVRPA